MAMGLFIYSCSCTCVFLNDLRGQCHHMSELSSESYVYCICVSPYLNMQIDRCRCTLVIFDCIFNEIIPRSHPFIT